MGLNAPTGAGCSLTLNLRWRCSDRACLNAPTGAGCSLTPSGARPHWEVSESQCTYRCGVLPDNTTDTTTAEEE